MTALDTNILLVYYFVCISSVSGECSDQPLPVPISDAAGWVGHTSHGWDSGGRGENHAEEAAQAEHRGHLHAQG